jgi:hypothetical protein
MCLQKKRKASTDCRMFSKGFFSFFKVIEGDQSANDGNLYIVPLLIRCDTLEEEPKLLTGNAPQKITATRTVAFKSLKILTTSHKMNETLFSFQFELRRYNGNSFEVVCP